jgi:sterol desaturase/sphingolipid hydroxylase (fatty acid hydroxylase superfamily)
LHPSLTASRLRLEAQKARRRFLPSTVVYTSYSLTLLALGLRSRPAGTVLLWFAGGIAAWTLLEYAVHRYVLHGRFPDGPRMHQRLAHKYFDSLHWEHHARPWDGNHINGTLKDTARFSAIFVALGFLAPWPGGPVFVAGLLLAYVMEEWVHQSVHFYNFDNPYFRYIRRHHLYHHSPKGMNAGYGLSSGIWDVVWNTRFPAEERRALYSHKKRSSRRRPPPPAEVPPSDSAAPAGSRVA